MRADIEIIIIKGQKITEFEIALKIKTDDGTLGFNLIPLKLKDAEILSKTLGLKMPTNFHVSNNAKSEENK